MGAAGMLGLGAAFPHVRAPPPRAVAASHVRGLYACGIEVKVFSASGGLLRFARVW